MKYIFGFLILVSSQMVFAENKVSVVIEELNNIDRGYSLEACGTANHSDGKKPLLVTLTHDKSNYSTLTSEGGKWCIVIKRWTFNGKVSAVASTLDFSEKSVAAIR